MPGKPNQCASGCSENRMGQGACRSKPARDEVTRLTVETVHYVPLQACSCRGRQVLSGFDLAMLQVQRGHVLHQVFLLLGSGEQPQFGPAP